MCENYSLLLSAYVDDEVTLAERAWLEGHLIGCAGCRAELRSLREASNFAALLPEVLPPPELRSQILRRTTQRPGVWARVRIGFARPAVWSPALAAGVLGVALLASQSDRSPQPEEQVARKPRPHAPAAKRSPKAAPPAQAVAKAPKEKRPESGIKRMIKEFREDIEETFTPPASAPVAIAADAPPARPPAPARRKEAVRTPRPVVAAKSAPAMRDPLEKIKQFVATGNNKLRRKRSDSHRPSSHPGPASTERAPDTESPSYMSEDDSTMAMAPRVIHTPDMPAPAAAPKNEASAPEATRPTNLIAEGLSKLAESPKKKRTDMDEMVEQINANALSTASTARQIKWKFARIKF